MNWSAREDYLVTEVMTATPQKLQLMLIDAAIRQTTRARELWKQQQHEPAGEALARAQQILTEMISRLNPEPAPELIKVVQGVYLFVFRLLVTAHLEHNDKKLAEAILVLEEERETWRQLCEQLGSNHAAGIPLEMPAQPRSFVA